MYDRERSRLPVILGAVSRCLALVCAGLDGATSQFMHDPGCGATCD